MVLPGPSKVSLTWKDNFSFNYGFLGHQTKLPKNLSFILLKLSNSWTHTTIKVSCRWQKNTPKWLMSVFFKPSEPNKLLVPSGKRHLEPHKKDSTQKHVHMLCPRAVYIYRNCLRTVSERRQCVQEVNAHLSAVNNDAFCKPTDRLPPSRRLPCIKSETVRSFCPVEQI